MAISFRAALPNCLMLWLIEKMRTFVQHTGKIRVIASPEAGIVDQQPQAALSHSKI